MPPSCDCGFPLTGARPSRKSRLGSDGNNAPSERAAVSYQQVSITNENRPLPSHRAGQRPVVQVDSRCIAPHKGLQYSSFWSIFEKNFHLFF